MAAANERGQKSRSEGQQSRSFRPTGTVPHLSGHDTLALTWDFAYGLNAGPSPCTGRGPRIGRRKTRLACGAPLRNRTVDLLLTIANSAGSLPAARPGQASGSADLALVTACDRSGHSADCGKWPVRVPGPAIGGVMGVRRAVQARPVGLSAGWPCPSRRSDDGQAITHFLYNCTGGALLSRNFRFRQENLNLGPFPHHPVTCSADNRSPARPKTTSRQVPLSGGLGIALMSSWSRQSKIRFAPGYRRVQRAPQITAATRDLRRFRSVEHRYGDAAHTGDGSSSVLTDPRRRSGTALRSCRRD
jgi:hypothetical protein